MSDNASFFGFIEPSTGKPVIKHDSTVVGRSNAILTPANSTLAIHIDGTANINIINNPFGDITKDFIVMNVTSTTQQVVTEAMTLTLNVTAISGTVTAMLIRNIEVDNA